ncbi:MAG: hypothetical protein IPO43_13300 [Rhodoferax sp.]|nr:hypothetical protein [Rhodoferax sp.]
MTLSPLHRILATLLLCVSAWHANATLVLAGSGTTVNFYYDDAFWSPGSATVVGDRITFALLPALSGSATDGAPAYADRASAPDAAAVLVLAKSGYSFASAPFTVTASLAGGYALAPVGGSVAGFQAASVHHGSFAGGLFTSDGMLGSTLADAGAVSDGVATSAAFAPTELALSAGALAGAHEALGLLDVFFYAFAQQDGSGLSSAQLDSLSYAVSAAAVSTLPEPGSLPLLASALGLGACIGRQRRAKRAA